MPNNQIDSQGIHIQTYAEIISAIVNGTVDVKGLKQIYGTDINVDSNTPDGQWINILALSKQDILNLIVQDYNSKDPDQAVGVALDAVSQYCGIYRKGGSYTRVSIIVTTDRTLNVNGQDTAVPFTVSDNAGNLFQLITSASLINGANALNFQAVNIGFIQVLANTITTPVTIQLGIVSVNNASTPYQIGVDQETDAQLRIRRQKSTSLPAQGFLQSLVAGLETIEGNIEAVVYENNTNSTDVNNIPAHSIWVIVDGGLDADIAAMIYRYRNAGVGMKGNSAVTVTQVDDSTINMYFDRVVSQDLYVQFTLTSISGGSIDFDAVVDGLAADYILGIYEPADISEVAAIIKGINPDLVISDAGVSTDGITYSNFVYPTDKFNKFSVHRGRITITNSSSSSSSSSRSSSSSSRSSSSSSSSCRSSSSSCKSSSSSSCRSSSSSSCRSSSSSSSISSSSSSWSSSSSSSSA